MTKKQHLVTAAHLRNAALPCFYVELRYSKAKIVDKSRALYGKENIFQKFHASSLIMSLI
jgi:hypothetical protein